MHDGTDGEQHDRTAMATLDRSSPSMFQGLSWDEWATTVAQDAAKDATEGDGESQEVLEEEEAQRKSDTCQVMRLKREDSNLFGICPTQDDFYLVICEQCGKVVKPQALEKHIEQRHGRPPGKPPDETPPKASIMQSQPEISPVIKGLMMSTQHGQPPPMDTIVGMHTGSVSLTQQQQQNLLDVEQTIVINPPLEAMEAIESQGPPQIEQTQVVTPVVAPPHSQSQPVSPLEEAQAPLLQSVQETEIRQGGLLPQEQHDVPPTLQNELPMQQHHVADGTNVRPVLAPVTTPDELMPRAPSSPTMGDLLDPTIAISPQLLVKPGTISVKACNPFNVPTNHKITTQGTKKQRKTPPLACLKIKSGSKDESKKSRPVKKSLPSPRKGRTGDNIPCKDREFDPNKHCGVWMEDIQRQCTRSLTCKTHALGLRRKVEGRRNSFDQLLKDHKAAKEVLIAERKAMVAAQEALKNASKGITVTTGTTLTIPTTSLANIQPAKANTVLIAPTLMNTPSLSAVAQSDMLQAVQKIMPVTVSPKTLSVNIVNSVLPIKRPPPACTPPTTPQAGAAPFSSSSSSEDLTSAPATPITPTPMEGITGQRTGIGDTEPVDRGGGGVKRPERVDNPATSCVQCHPRPTSMCTFGARQVGKGMYVFNRRLDHLRSTMALLVEKHLRPPPLKKLCTAADSSSSHHHNHHQASGLSTATTSSVSNMQSSTIISRPTTCTAGPSVTRMTAGSVTSRGTPGSARVTPSAAAKAGSTKLSSAKSSMVHNSVGKGQSTGKKSSAKQQSGANRTAKSLAGSHPPTPKTPRSRKKSSGAGGSTSKGHHHMNATNTTTSTSVIPNMLTSSVVTVSTAAVSNASYSFVTNSGLQAADLVGSGLVGIDASGNITGDPNLLKFVVTSVGGGTVNGGADTIFTHATTSGAGTITVPIFNNAMGTTPVLLSNLGPVSLQQHDGKMNIKSRPQSAGTISKADKARARKHSGGQVAQTVTVTNAQPIMMDTYLNTQDNKGNSGVSTGVIFSAQPIMSPAASPLLRPGSSSPQLASSLPNGIIPSPTVAIKPFPASTVSVNHVQSAISPSRSSTPSPGGAGSAEASPCSGVVSHQTYTGVSQTAGGKKLQGKGGSARSKSRKQRIAVSQQQAVAPAPAPSQVHLPFTAQQLLTNLVARDAHGKMVPILQNHQIFNSIPVQQGGMASSGTVMQVTTATDQGNKGTQPSSQTVIPQAIALTLQQQRHHQGQPIRLQTTQSLAGQSQVVIGPNDDTRQELSLQH